MSTTSEHVHPVDAGKPVGGSPPPLDVGNAAAPATPDGRPGSRAARRRRLVLAVPAVGMLLVVALAPLSRLLGAGPIPPPSTSPVVSPVPGPVDDLRALPLGLPPGATVRTVDDIRSFAVAALGPSGAEQLLGVMQSGQGLAGEAARYPYRYDALEPVLDGAPPADFRKGATALGAALTLLAAQPDPAPLSSTTAIDNAGPAAFAVLDRARADGQCAPQLDLLLLLAADVSSGASGPAEQLAAEAARAEQVCTDDPMPGWLLGQGQLRSLPARAGATPPPPGVVTMERLVERFPGSVVAHTGLGDARLSAGMSSQGVQPFTARAAFRAALDEYNRAALLGGGRAATVGQARALIGLGEPERAAALLTPLLDDSDAPGGLLELAIAAREAAHDFDAAEALARRLDQLGPSAYVPGGGLIPDPGGDVYGDAIADTAADTSLPLSLGAETMTPLRTVLVEPGGKGGASAQDLSFLPAYRPSDGVTGTAAACAAWAWRRDAVLAGHPADALADWPQEVRAVRPESLTCDSAARGLPTLRGIAELASGAPPTSDNDGDAVVDQYQNLLRWAGDLPAARRAVESWQSERGSATALPALRLGEIDFLQRDFERAAADFRLAGRVTRIADEGNDLAVYQAELDRGAALIAAGRTAEGEATLRPLDQLATRGYAFQSSLHNPSAGQFAAVSYYAALQLADVEREAGRVPAAVEDYEAALAWAPLMETFGGAGVGSAVLANNAALAYLARKDLPRATQLAAEALGRDPQNPVFLMTAASVAQRKGDVPTAVRRNRDALRNDPGAFPAANDLGVLLARTGQGGEAERAFRQAVGARPDYALGWFNLGVLESGMGPAHVLTAQSALGRAFALDPALRERRPELTIDDAVYRSGLDLSKPLPPSWSLMQSDRPSTAASVGLLALIGAGLGVAKAVARPTTKLPTRWLGLFVQRLESLPLIGRLRHPAWAVAATAATFLLGGWRRTSGSVELTAYVLGVLAVTAAAMWTRVGVARWKSSPQAQVSWGPGILFGLATGAIGFPWAPLPVVKTHHDDDVNENKHEDDKDAGVHLAAPTVLAVVAMLLFLESAWLHTPLAEAWAIAALVMAASVLLPVEPLDGARAGKAGVAASLGLIATAVLVGLGLI